MSDLAAYKNAAGDAQRALRDKMVYSLIAEIDYAYYDYATKLFINEGGFHVASDFLQLGLAAASTVTNGERGKTILSALLSGVTGVNLSVDKNFFRQQTVQAIANAMEANRDRIHTIILQQLRSDVVGYPFEEARSDLIKYFFAGTLPAGLQQVSQDAAVDAQTQKVNLNQQKVANISEADVRTATNLNQAITKAFQSGDLSKVVAWLKAMGAIGDELPDRNKVESAMRDLLSRTTTDPALRAKSMAEAKKAGLIQ